jgi:hypothetical protein
MSDLTKEYFDKQLMNLATKKDISELARITADGFADLQKRLDVTERMGKIERRMESIENAINLSKST